MTWCKDTARDAAVRAAEDNRTGPLPTLGEAIAAPFACTACGGYGMDHRCRESCKECDGLGRAMIPKSVSASSAVDQENKGDGMRTERVTLEVTVDPRRIFFPGQWHNALRQSGNLRPGESVRVVSDEERQAERLRECAVAALDRECDEAFIKAERLTQERDAAIRERDALRAERITQALTADRFAAAVMEADTLKARVAELEASAGVAVKEVGRE